MLSVTDPDLNARVSLRYALSLFPLSFMAPYYGLTSWYFLIPATCVNTFMTWGAWKFWRHSNDANARHLFFGSLVHLPLFLGFCMVHKSKDEEAIVGNDWDHDESQLEVCHIEIAKK